MLSRSFGSGAPLIRVLPRGGFHDDTTYRGSSRSSPLDINGILGGYGCVRV